MKIFTDKDALWLLEATADAMLIVDHAGRIRFANEALARMFGYARAELLALAVEALIPERFRAAHAAQRRCFGDEMRPMGRGLQLFGLHKDGSEFAVDVSLSPLTTPDGPRVMATVHDVSRRHRAEEALREREARLKAIVDTALDAIITIDERGHIYAFNPAAERLFGYREDEIKGHNVARLMPEPDRSAHDGYLHHYLETGERRIIGVGREVLAQRRDGTLFPADLSVSELSIGGRRMFTGMVHDISVRKRAEARQTELLHDLGAANEELKSFAYVVSHDLKAPLRAIGSLADWLVSDYTAQLDAQGKEYLGLLKSRVSRLDALIDGVLEYSRVGRIKETRTAVDLNELVGQVIQSLAPPPGVVVRIESRLPTVVIEPTRVQQLFQNLIGNALKHLDKPQGEIRIACADAGMLWKFSVADNGPGIDPQHHQRIFQLFQTLTPRDRKESTGVGLALVKKIVELYGGQVEVESRLGEGSTFFFTLPKAGQDTTGATPV